MTTTHFALLSALLALVGCDGAPLVAGDAGPCEPGTLGCECARGDVCGASEDGELLLCHEGVCIGARCMPGSIGCVCRAGSGCDGDSAECRDGICRGTACAAGELGCECLAGACNASLYCDRTLGGGTCVDGTGFPGGACPEMGPCRDRSRCDSELDVCVPCSPGSRGCVPNDGRCNDGLVLAAGRCLPPEPGAPSDPRCYTPCRGDLIAEDGTTRRCGADGLIDGCVGELTCVEGSCVPAGASAPTCATDTECPGRQRCIAGGCYYDCEHDTDCGVGRVCHQHACRVPCPWPTTAGTECPAGTACQSPSGAGGVCTPISPSDPEARAHTRVEASFALDTDTLILGEGIGRFRLAHDAHGRETFTIERLSHRAYDREGALVDEAQAGAGDAPLDWVELRYGDGRALAGDLVLVVEPGCDVETCPPIEVRSAAPTSASWTRWEGTLRVRHTELGDRYVSLTWARGLDGRWTGTMYYLASFGDGGLTEWLSGDHSVAGGVENALVQRWAAFRGGRMMGGFREMQAVLTATANETWRWPSTRQACLARHPDGRAACYLFDGDASGLRTYVTNERESPVPTGVTELPFAMSLRSDGDPRRLRGRIESSAALHFAGDPAIELTFASSPTSCAAGVGTDCVAFVSGMQSQSAVGGRYVPASGSCPAGYETQALPWLVAGFREGTFTGETGAASRTECRDALVPFTTAGAADRNASLAGANPIPDGRARCRTLRALDGALVASESLFVLFEERLHECGDPNDPEALSAYGYMLLARQPDALTSEDFRGNVPAPVPERTSTLGVACEADLITEVLGAPVAIDGTPATRPSALALAEALRTGRRPGGSALAPSLAHYYCRDTGLFDGGPYANGSPSASRVACPPGSNVTYFAFADASAPTEAELAAHDCQASYDEASGARGSCGSVLDSWIGTGRVQAELVWSCTSSACDDRYDLRAGKAFYLPGEAIDLPLEAAVAEAFRYKLRFRSADGRTVGFAPVVCDPSSDLTPYCYDPEAIERLRARIDCLAAIYREYSTTFAPEMTALRGALSQSLSASEIHDPRLSSPIVVDGFERLYAELLIMLGDDALTNAYRSRFDSAATRGASFQGTLFEPDGIDLSGVAGYELRSFYQAAQYYQLALDRLYELLPVLYAALARGNAGTAPDDVVTPGTVTYYLERVIRGAAQKSRAWAEIARRYHRLHRADLARHVLERAYAGSYLESVVLARLMQRITSETGSAHAAELQRALDDAMRRYRVAMTDMRQVHETLTDEVTYFGFAADYVPFPVRADNDFRAGNAFEDVLRTTLEFVADAHGQEETAIASSRAFDTDAESFQAEIVRLQRSYEERVAPICGYFAGDDGRTYPAIARYASRSEGAARLGDPCGRMGNGDIHDQLLRIEELASQRQLLTTRFTHIREEMSDEAERVDRQCELISDIASFEYRQGDRTLNLQDQVRVMSLVMSKLDRDLSSFHAVLGFATSGQGTVAGIYGGTALAVNTTAVALQGAIAATEHEIGEIQLRTARWRTERQCDQIRIDSEMLMRSKLRQLVELRLEAQQLHLQIAIADADLRRLVLASQRIQQELAEAEQLTIRVESARNDPNVRLYRNDAILNADRSFELAAQHAYRATRVLEYYSSRSYPGLERLFQIRMVARGEDNLERYMADLRNEYLLFEEEARSPANRVERLSLMDDILGIPLLREDGTALSQSEREELLAERLTDPTMLDANGHLSIPFQTSADELSPCTRNHKINFIELAIQGSSLGDDEGSVNIWQEGTGVIESLGEGTQYYRLPPALSVVQVYFNRSNTVFDPAVYRRFELRERPYLNTQWRFVLDQRDDRDNQDIDLREITDAYLYVYYTDFTDPSSCRD